MRTPTRVHRFRRLIVVGSSVLIAFAFAACGSSSTSGAGPSTTQSTSATSLIPPSPSSIPPALQAPCAALGSALAMADLHPKNNGTWSAEQQRIATDAASNVALYSAAESGVPPDVARALVTLKAYATWLGETVLAAPSFTVATSAVNAYPELVGASLATATVDTWRRSNC